MNATAALPRLVLWRGDGCHLCDETAELVRLLVDERARAGAPVPRVEHRRIADDPAIERELFEQIPVLEMDGERLLLAIRPGPIRAWLAARLDGPADADAQRGDLAAVRAGGRTAAPTTPTGAPTASTGARRDA